LSTENSGGLRVANYGCGILTAQAVSADAHVVSPVLIMLVATRGGAEQQYLREKNSVYSASVILKLEAYAELRDARRAKGGGDLAKFRVGQNGIGNRKSRGVRKVEELAKRSKRKRRCVTYVSGLDRMSDLRHR
jgi:hypothetical protein